MLKSATSAGVRRKVCKLFELGAPTEAKGFSDVAGLPESIARRQAERAEKRLIDLELRADIRELTWTGVIQAFLDREIRWQGEPGQMGLVEIA